jgi:PAS domain S-box-containing protein
LISKNRHLNLIAIWLGIAAVLFTGAVITYRQFTEIDEQSRYVNHTHLTLSCLNDIQSNCLKVENANRALALTSEQKYLQQKQTAKVAAFDKLNAFQHLTVDNPRQQQLIPRLTNVMTKRSAVGDKISEIIKVNTPGSPQIQTAVSKGSSMNALLDSLIGEMKAEEERLLVVRLHHQGEETQRTRTTLFALGCFAAVCLGIAVWMIKVYVSESKESDILFRAIFDNTYQFTGMLAADGKVINANKTALDFSNVKAEDVVGRNFWDLTWWNDAKNNINGKEQIRKAVEDAGNGKFVQLETNVFNPRNHKITIDMSLKPVLDESGKVLFIIQEGRDITQRVNVENILKINEHKLKSLLACLAEGVYQLDKNGNVIYLNTAAETMIGYSQSEIMGKNMYQLIHANTPSGKVRTNDGCPVPKVISNREIYRETEDFFQRKDGSFIPVEFVSSPVIEGNECVGTVIAFQDITLRKESENRVSEFYSTVSHELRTPLTSIRGALRLLEGGKGGEISEKAMKLVKMGRTECDRLVRLINDMLDIRKIEAGKLELKPILLTASMPVAEALENLTPYATENRVKLKSDITEDFSFQADQDRLTQILTNLISNAIKFSPAEGTVLVKVGSGNVLSDGSKSVRFEVTDNGCGISEAAQQKLFGLFQQVDSSDSRAKGGTGLGLAITKALVEQHQGKIGIISKENEGSTFWFELPRVNTEIPVQPQPAGDHRLSQKTVR